MTGCIERPAPPASGAGPAGAGEPAEVVGTPAEDAPSEEERAAILEILREMADRPKCNRIMGCPGAVKLAGYGRAIVPGLADVLAQNLRADGYWYFELIKLLGQSKDARALPILHALLEDPRRWEVPIRAAQAIGRLGFAESRAPLEDALGRAVEGDNVALQAAVHGALTHVAPSEADAHRDALLALVPQDAAAVEATPPVILDILVEEVRMGRIPRALPGVRLAVMSDNRFVRAQALDTLARLSDTGGIPYALARLDDKLPSVRRKALTALQEITGIRTMTDPAQWRRWCEKNGLAEIPE